MNPTSHDAGTLLYEQLKEWDLAKANFEALKNVRTKEFQFDGFVVRVQFNPARILSSAAKVDAGSIRERKCFLCAENLPKEQRGIPFGEEYRILVNPYPIFPEHFTIPAIRHTDQLIAGRYGDMLDLAKGLDDYTLFYNGPRCGASAPDHVHFQAGIKGFLPIERESDDPRMKETIYESAGMTVSALRNCGRNGFLVETGDREEAVRFFDSLCSLLETGEGDKEPMMNILAWYDEGRWRSVIFPRRKHRPDRFYAEGDDNLLISPASVDMGGVFITPLEKDFEKIAPEDITAILEEVIVDNGKMQSVIDNIKGSLWNRK